MLIVSPNFAHASLLNDDITIRIKVTTLFDQTLPLTVPGTVAFTNVPETNQGGGSCDIQVTVNADGDVTLRFLCPTDADFKTLHEFWIEDLDWTDAPGQVTDLSFVGTTCENPPTSQAISHTTSSVHLEITEWDCDDPEPPAQFEDLFYKIESVHGLPISCGPKTILNLNNQCIPDLSQVCGKGTIPDFDVLMCFGLAMGAVGGELLDINTVSLLVGAIGTNPVITGLVAVTLAGVVGQAVWFVHRRKKK